MDKQDKIEEIDRKCRIAGCIEARSKRHLQVFVYERWDVHPPDDFKAWYVENGPARDSNPVTGWNSDLARQEFFKSKGKDDLL